MTEINFSDFVNAMPTEDKNTVALRVTVLGGGSFGTAIANTAARNGCDTTLWIRDAKTAQEINEKHVNTRYLPDFKLDKNLKVSSDIEQAVRDKDLILVTIPSHS